jgi:hypothetical protein
VCDELAETREEALMRYYPSIDLEGLGKALKPQELTVQITLVAYRVFWLENLKRREYLENLGVDGRKILEWILSK